MVLCPAVPTGTCVQLCRGHEQLSHYKIITCCVASRQFSFIVAMVIDCNNLRASLAIIATIILYSRSRQKPSYTENVQACFRGRSNAKLPA